MNTSIKKIIVPIDPSEYAKAASLRACDVALVHEATLTGVTVLDSPGIWDHVAPVSPQMPVMMEETVRELLRDAGDQIAKVRAEFEATCSNRKVNQTAFSLEGVPASRILESSILHDVIVIGLRTFFHFETSLKAGNSLASLLKRTVTPILGVPANDADRQFKRALVAYDGSMNSARTLREFVAFAKPYDFSITIATADLDARHALWHLEEAAGYFRAHGVEDFDTRHIKEKSIPDYIVDEYDLIAAGIHSGRLVKDRFVGSFTNRLIDRDDKTLFLSH